MMAMKKLSHKTVIFKLAHSLYLNVAQMLCSMEQSVTKYYRKYSFLKWCFRLGLFYFREL